jgi:aspartate aminotransferase-like enzyme
MFINVSDKKLFTPGPLGCSQSVKEAMLRDMGSRDEEFMNKVKVVRQKLLDIAGEYYFLCEISGSLSSGD